MHLTWAWASLLSAVGPRGWWLLAASCVGLAPRHARGWTRPAACRCAAHWQCVVLCVSCFVLWCAASPSSTGPTRGVQAGGWASMKLKLRFYALRRSPGHWDRGGAGFIQGPSHCSCLCPGPLARRLALCPFAAVLCYKLVFCGFLSIRASLSLPMIKKL